MAKDPIVEEIHAVREGIAQRFSYDLGQIVADIRARQEANPERIVRKGDLAKRPKVDRLPTEKQRDAA